MLRYLPILLFPLTAHAAVTSSPFGQLPDHTPVTAYTLTNPSGLSATILTHGATLQSLRVPNKDHTTTDIVLGFDTLDGYLSHANPFFGAIAGRNANRIANATFPLDGVEIHLLKNDGPNNLHSGPRGFDKVEWSTTKIDDHTVEFSYTSPDGENGFPGTLTAHVRYSLSDTNDLRIDYAATTDKPTLCNLTNHSYFNLAGTGTILSQTLMIDADQFTPNTKAHTPTGEILPVANTPFDFRTPHPISDHLHDDNDQLHDAGGYDHNFVLAKKDGLRLAATAVDPASGRKLDVLTTEPGIQLYTANGLHNLRGKANAQYPQFGAFCLETQHFPDAPNHPTFPSTELKPTATYHSATVFRISP